MVSRPIASLAVAEPQQVPLIVDMENLPDTTKFIAPESLEKHLAEMQKPGILYLTINVAQTLSGFLILCVYADKAEVELRRIVVANRGIGIGQAAITAMEEYCASQFNCRRIWLDVFEFNDAGRHLYEKMGYRYFDNSDWHGKKLLNYEKFL